MSYSTPPPPSPYPGPTPARSGFARGLVLFGLVAALSVGLGVLVGYLVFAPGGEGDEGGARANAENACALVARMDPDDPLGLESETSPLESPEYGEMTAIHGLAMAAGAEDDTYSEMAEAGELMLRGYQRFDQEGIVDAFADLEDVCADLP